MVWGNFLLIQQGEELAKHGGESSLPGAHKNIHRSMENAKDLHVPHGIAHYNSVQLTNAENSGNHVIQLQSLRFIQTQHPFPIYCRLIPESEQNCSQNQTHLDPGLAQDTLAAWYTR
jgi:hypothetical protein